MNNVFIKAMKWIDNNTIDGHGITVTNKEKLVYPEVTGYYIPSLLQWNRKDLAIAYADYMCDIQKEDGSWFDPHNKEPYVFDTCQILKGLVAISKECANRGRYQICLKKGCDWIIAQIDADGRLKPCRETTFSDQKGYSELIHIYCLSPLVEASEILNDENYKRKAEQCLAYYINNYEDKILDFHLLAHFYAYVMEGLVDMGKDDLSKKAMDKIALIQEENGMIPAYCDVGWTCSTALFQFAITWYKLGEIERANATYNFACTLQNESGGWYGRYPVSKIDEIVDRIIYKVNLQGIKDKHEPNYFPNEEISWANKFYLDATWWNKRMN